MQMTEEDQKYYKSIIKKIISSEPNKLDEIELTHEEVKWMDENIQMKAFINRLKTKYQFMSYHKDAQGTIEEILFMLDLSDRYYH